MYMYVQIGDAFLRGGDTFIDDHVRVSPGSVVRDGSHKIAVPREKFAHALTHLPMHMGSVEALNQKMHQSIPLPCIQDTTPHHNAIGKNTREHTQDSRSRTFTLTAETLILCLAIGDLARAFFVTLFGTPAELLPGVATRFDIRRLRSILQTSES